MDGCTTTERTIEIAVTPNGYPEPSGDKTLMDKAQT
jgi:hypothetical protein